MGHPSRVIATCAGTRCAGGASLLLDIYCHIAKYATCGGCEVIPGVAQFTYCQDCGGKWCDACTPHVDMCTGSEHSSIVENDGCFKSMCLTCQHKDGAYFTSCDSCDGAWCNRCLPDSIVRCTGRYKHSSGPGSGVGGLCPCVLRRVCVERGRAVLHPLPGLRRHLVHCVHAGQRQWTHHVPQVPRHCHRHAGPVSSCTLILILNLNLNVNHYHWYRRRSGPGFRCGGLLPIVHVSVSSFPPDNRPLGLVCV